MERSEWRLYSGPLSLEAQKILEALQAQRRQLTRQIHRYDKHDHLLKNRQHDREWEPLTQSYTSQQQERNAHLPSTYCKSQWSDSATIGYSQSSQTLDFSQPSQASSSSWEPSSHSRTNQSGSYYQLSHMYSQRNNCDPPALQSSQALPSSQYEVSETDARLSQVDRYTLSLQTPHSLSEHQFKAWERSEEITPQFTIEFPSEDSEELFQKTPPQKDSSENPMFPSILESSLVKKQRPSTDKDLPTTESYDQHGPNKQIRLNYSLEKDSECGPHLNTMFVKEGDAPENIEEVLKEKQGICNNDTNPEVPRLEIEDALPCHKSNPLTLYGANFDVTLENQPALSEDKTSSVLPQSNNFSGSYNQPERYDVNKTSEIPSAKGPLTQSDSSGVIPFSADADKETTGEGKDVIDVELEVAAEESNQDAQIEDANEALLESYSDGKFGDVQHEATESDNTDRGVSSADKTLTMATINYESTSLPSEHSNCPAPVMSHECNDKTLTPTIVEEDTRLHMVNTKISLHSARSKVKKDNSVEVEGCTTTSSLCHDSILSATVQNDGSKIMMSKMPYQPHSKPSITLKRKYEAPQPQSANNISSKATSAKRPLKWEPPRSSQEQRREARKEINHQITEKSLEGKKNYSKHLREVTRHASAFHDCTPPKQSKYISKSGKPVSEVLQPGSDHREVRNQFKPGSLTSSLTSDPRVIDASKINQEKMDYIVKKAQRSLALVLTMVFRDGTTQLDPEQKLTPPVCGLLLLIKTDLDNVSETLAPNDSLVYFKLEHAPAWAQQPTPRHQLTFTRDLLLQVLMGSQLVVCYKAKDVLRVVLQLFKGELTWKQVIGCQIHDPQVSGWLLDPADPASCFQDLLNKHCRIPRSTPALGNKKVSQIIDGLYSLYKLNRELGSKLQSQALWGLYSDMELKMIPVLAAMEVCCIHVDKEALRRTSDLLGTKMRQLEQEAHKAAGQKFLLTSSTQLRTVLFEKLHLHERCENKKLPKTINKQQSTSEAALLQLQDLHPLPKIILEYRQIHKIKSTFVDGILSCMMTKNYISSTWYQTSVVTGRISAKHPNFQALPRQPLQVTRKSYIAGKEEEVVTVHPRAMFVPKEGWSFLSADFCQVELRLLAHLSSDPELLRVFTNPEADVFSMLASQWKGVSEKEVTSEDREHAKRIVYSVVYGAGSERLSGILGVSTEQARRFQDSFLQSYKEVQTFIQKTVTECQNKGYVLSIMGRRRTLHNINSPDWGVRMQAERQAVNFVVQGSAADLCKMAMIRIFNLLSTSSSLSARLIAQLHDELLYEVADSEVEEFAAVVKSTMESLVQIDQLGVHLKVPLKVAVSSGKSWGSMSELIVLDTSF